MKLTLTPEELLKYIQIPGLKVQKAEVNSELGVLELDVIPPQEPMYIPTVLRGPHVSPWKSPTDASDHPGRYVFTRPIGDPGATYATSTPAEER